MSKNIRITEPSAEMLGKIIRAREAIAAQKPRYIKCPYCQHNSIVVSNTDDHLRNHGFLLTPTGWRLAPLYDVNPVPSGDRLSLNVSEYDNTIDLELALEVADYFGLAPQEAEQAAEEVCKTVSGHWEQLAGQYGLSRGAIEYMRPAFSLP